jgi:outer membrane protein assembly factor BamB
LRRVLFGPLEPWSLDRPPRPFADVCFEDRSILGHLAETEARQLLEKVDGREMTLWQVGARAWATLRFRGLAKLRRWMPDAALRLSFSGGPLRIHFWDGKQGLALYYYPAPPHWAAYRTTWQPAGGHPLPASALPAGAPPPMLLVATDDHRAWRLSDDTCEVRCQDGAIVLTKGDVRLLTAPLGGQPTAVYLESPQGVVLRDLAMCRSEPAPDDPLRPHRLVLGQQPPAALGWHEELSQGTRFARLADGGVELSARAGAGPAWVTLPIGRPGLYEVAMEVEAASPGSSLFLSDQDQPPFQGIEFVRHPGSAWTTLVPSRRGKPGAAAGPDHEQRAVAYAGGRQWLRLVSTPKVWKCWTSGDGVHWGQLLPPLQGGQAARFLGLHVDPSRKGPPPDGNAGAAIRIRTVQVRQLDGITALAPEDLQQAAFARLAETGTKANGTDVPAWRAWVEAGRPAAAEPAAWRIASAVAGLAAGATMPGMAPGSPQVARAALEDLLADGLRRAGSLEARLALLQDAALLSGPNDIDERYLACWEQLERSLLVDGSRADFDLARRSFMAASLAPQKLRPEPVPWQVARDRLLLLVARQQWEELHRWCRQLVYWHRAPDRRIMWPPEQAPLGSLVEWALDELGAARSSPDGRKTVVTEMNWQRSLALPVNREAFNFLSELQAAADDRLFQDVAHTLAAAILPAGGGLVPDTDDPVLYASFPTAVQLLVDRHPQIRRAIADRSTAADRLRVAETMARGDVSAVERLTVQYFGTPVAAAAHVWLGDRALSGGAFNRAWTEYRRGQAAGLPGDKAPPGAQPALAARIRLAAALLGRQEGEAVRGPVQLGGQEIAPEQFEQWVREILGRSGSGSPGPGPAETQPRGKRGQSPFVRSTLRAVPANGDCPLFPLEPQRRATFDGDLGQPGPPPAPPPAGDWPARQLAVAVTGDLMLASNRFQVAAFALPGGERRWVYGLGGEQGPRHGWRLVPMRPAVAGQHVYARLLPKSGHPQIACLDRATGKRLWQRDCPGDIVSDPLLLGPRLLVLTVESSSGQPVAPLAWVELDPDSGDVLARKPVLELRNSWDTCQMCQATVVGQRVVAMVGGLVFCFDPDEQIVWLRSNLCPPPSLDPSPGTPYPQPPLADGGRLYVTQSGLLSVECLDAETGRLYWRRCLLGLDRILGLIDGRLLVRAGESLVALRAETGDVLWQRDVPGLLEGIVQCNTKELLCGGRKQLDGDNACPVLHWLDLQDGRTVAQSPLVDLRSKSPALGPMAAAADRLWCFVGVYGKDNSLEPRRELVELVPQGPAEPPAAKQP